MFSEKYGYTHKKIIQNETISNELRKRIWNLFYRTEIDCSGLDNQILRIGQSRSSKIESIIADKLGFEHDVENRLKLYLIEKCSWFEVYNFVEIHLQSLPEEERTKRSQQYNQLFENEKSGYRIINGEVVPIVSAEEIHAIDSAINSKYDSVRTHIKKALSLYSDFEKPDYENSIKESISAVEAMCCIIIDETGSQATLGKTIKKLKDKGIHIHPAMESAFSSLYGYTSDENGIRHGGIDFTNAPAEDAKYMLITCSAFVNYLIEKWSKFDLEG